MDVFKIDGRSYDVLVTELKENFNVLYSENTGRTMSKGARMVLDPLGTFFGHEITIRRKPGKEFEFDDLYDYISQPRYDGVLVEVLHNQTTLMYEAYISSGKRSAFKIDTNNRVYWDEFQIKMIPMEAQILPI